MSGVAKNSRRKVVLAGPLCVPVMLVLVAPLKVGAAESEWRIPWPLLL